MTEARVESDELDLTLRAFAVADAFEHDAAELRADVRRLRAAGRSTPSWPRRSARPELSPTLSRIAVEAAFLIAAAVFVGVAGFGAVTVVLALAAAWLVVCGVEWVAHRERAGEEPEPLAPSARHEESLLDALRPRRPARSRVRS